MNNSRRAIIRKAIKYTHEAFELIDLACEEENECLAKYPENLEGSPKYEAIETYADLLEEAREQLEYACEAVDQILS